MIRRCGVVLALWIAAILLAPGCKRGGAAPVAPDGPGHGSGATPELVVQAGSHHLITDVEFSPDGRYLAVVSVDGLVKLFDIVQGKEWRTYSGAAGPLYKATFSPDMQRIAATGLDKSVHIWDLASGELYASLPGHTGWVWDVEFSSDGKFLASGAGVQDTMAVIWDVEGKAIRHALQHTEGISDVAWSKDGRTLVTASDRVVVWNAESGGRLGEIEQKPMGQGQRSLYFDPSGELLAVGLEAGGVLVYDAASWTEIQRISTGSLLGWKPDGSLIVHDGTTVVTHEARSGLARSRWPSAEGVTIRDVAFSPDGQVAASFDDMHVHLFDAVGGVRLRTIESTFWNYVGSPLGNDVELLHVAWSPAAPVLATAGFDGFLRVWDLRRGLAPKAVPAGPSVEKESGTNILGWADPKVGLIHDVWFSRDGRHIFTLDHEGVVQWDTGTQAKVRRFPAPGATVGSQSPDGATLAIGHENAKISLFDQRTGALLRANEGGALDADCQDGPTKSMSVSAALSGLGWSTDGTKLYAVHRETATFAEFDAKTLALGLGGCAHRNRLNAVAFSPTGDKLAAGGGLHMLAALGGEQAWSDNSVRVINLEGEKKVLRHLKGHTLAVLDAAFSPDGNTLATASVDRTARLWDIRADDPTGEVLKGHGAEVDSLTFSHDGKYLATASYDLTVKIWDVAERKEVATFVALGPDGFVVETPEHHYSASRQGFASVAFRLGPSVVPVELFDLRLNRPDLVLRALGYAPPDLLNLYEKAWRKRLVKMHLDEQALDPSYHLPQVAIAPGTPVSTGERSVRLQVEASDSRFRLDRLNVYANDIPIHGSKGIDLKDKKAQQHSRELNIELLPGRNKIQVSVMNSAGTESLKETVEIVSTASAQPSKLVVLTVGVSKYADSHLNLKYAAKDAKDIGSMFRNKGQNFSDVEVLEILDGEARREQILAARKKLQSTKSEDQVVVFVAGHGMLDDNLDYYFVTHDFNRKSPAKRGLTYEQLEGLIDGIPARRKLMLMDTCHSGEVDEDAVRTAPPLPGTVDTGAGAGTVKVTSDFRSFSYSGAVKSPDQSQDLLSQLFADLRRGSGAMVISSASGAEFALESAKWKNGVFTYSVLQGMQSGAADLNHDGTIRVSELREYVVHEVQRLTHGAQTPTSRRENLEFDFPVF